MSETAQARSAVADLHIGNTRVKICDDCCRFKTPEEIKAILDRIAMRAIDSLTAGTAQDYAKT